MKKEKNLEYSRALVPSKNALYKLIIAILIVVIIALICVYLWIMNRYNEQVTISTEDTPAYNVNKENPVLEREIGTTQMKIDYIDNCMFSISYPEVGIEEIDNTIFEYARELKQNFLNEYEDSSEGANIFTQHVDYKSFVEPEDDMKLVFIETITNNLDIILSSKEYTHYFDLKTGNEIDEKKMVVVNPNPSSVLRPLEDEAPIDFNILFSGDIVKYAVTALNVRSDKDVESEKLGLLEEGQPVEVISGDEEWESIIYEGNFAYVKSGYLTRKRNLHKTVELEILDRGIDPSKPMVAITYDDGPNPKSTPRILDTLEQYNAVATFFDLGQLVNSYPDIVRREEAIGCEVGNHTYSHKNLNTLTDAEIQEEINNSEDAFIKALGHKTVLFRPPYGNSNITVRENWNYPIIKWNVDSLDWKTRDRDKILSEIRKINNYDGHIILLHSIYGTTADATEILVPELIDRGYQLVTVSELAFYKGHTTLQTAEEYRFFN